MNREVLHIGVSESGGKRVLRLTGELDSYTSSRLAWVTQTWLDGAKMLIVNLDGLEYIDSSGLSALVRVWMKARDNGAKLLVSCRNPRIHRILEITGLLNLFDVMNTAPESRVSAQGGYGSVGIHQPDESTSPVSPPMRRESLGR